MRLLTACTMSTYYIRFYPFCVWLVHLLFCFGIESSVAGSIRVVTTANPFYFLRLYRTVPSGRISDAAA